MEYIAGLLYASGGLSWQRLGPMGSDAAEEAVTINFAFHGRPPRPVMPAESCERN